MFTEIVSDSARCVFAPLRGFVSIFLLVFLFPLSPVRAAYEITVYRMQQLEVRGTLYGSKSAIVSGEATVYIPSSALSSLARRCVLVRLTDVSSGLLRTANQQQSSCVIILLPPSLRTGDLDSVSSQQLREVEADLLAESHIPYVPIYFAFEEADMAQMYENLRYAADTTDSSNIFRLMWALIAKTTVQLSVSASVPSAIPDPPLFNIIGRLNAGASGEDAPPAVLIVAHYDATAIAPALASGTDANGSGVVALVELARLLARLYRTAASSTRGALAARKPRYQVYFLLSAGGKLNYFGTRKFLEESMESELGVALNRGARAQAEEGAGAGEGVEFALCLDSLLGSLTALPASQPLGVGAAAGSENAAPSAANVNVDGDSGAASEESVESAEREQKSSAFEGEPKEAQPEEDKQMQEQERAEEELDVAADPLTKASVAAGEPSAAKLYMHVSRQPKPDSSLAAFYKHVEQVACEKWGGCGAADAALLQRPETAEASGEEQQAVRTVHKKIRLSDEYLAWEHEIFSVKRAPFQAVTFSARAAADLRARGSLLDRGLKNQLAPEYADRVAVLAEALARFLVGVPPSSSNATISNSILTEKPSLTRMESVLRAVTGEPRAQQVLAWQAALAGRKLPPALQQVELALARAIYPSLSSNPAAASAAGGQTPSRLAHAVKPLALHVDKAEPEFVLFDGFQYNMNIYRTKSNVFDFVITGLVLAYLVGLYFACEHQSRVLAICVRAVHVLMLRAHAIAVPRGAYTGNGHPASTTAYAGVLNNGKLKDH